MIKIENQKGMIYSLMTLFLVGSSIFLVTVYFNTLDIEGQNFANKIRADDFNNFYNSLVRDLERSLKISTFRALLHATDLTVTTGQPFSNSESRIAEMIFTGTLDGTDVISLQGTSIDPCNTVECWRDKYSDLATDAGFDLTVVINSVSVAPYDSWNLNSSAEIAITLEDSASKMVLRRTVTQSSKVPITSFEDPLYIIETKGRITRIIDETYQVSEIGPSYLDRLEGRTTISPTFTSQTPNIIGLESCIDFNEFRAKGITVNGNPSCTDYLYFSG